jgi:DNA-binding response OmpR family regulator
MTDSADRSHARFRRPQSVVLLAGGAEACAFYGELLGAAGFAVTPALDCGQALQEIHRDSTDLLVAVFQRSFPDDCLTLCRRLREGDMTRRLPVILAGVNVTDADLRAASDAGALALLVPPNDGTKLLAVLSGILAAGRRVPLKAGLREPIVRIRGVH